MVDEKIIIDKIENIIKHCEKQIAKQEEEKRSQYYYTVKMFDLENLIYLLTRLVNFINGLAKEENV